MLPCFKAYDIRGCIPDEINADLAYKIACAYATYLSPKKVIVGYDARLESPELALAICQGLMDQGVDVIDIGLCGTEEVTFQAFHLESQGVDGGIMVTASHNPKDYNGMKLVSKGSKPISGDSGLFKIRDLVLETQEFPKAEQKGTIIKNTDKSAYIKHLLSYVDVTKLKPLKIVVNPGNGPAGLVVKELEKHLPFNFVYLHENVDGNFPHGVPNPILIENRKPTQDKILETKADLGIAWDGDFDRCFFFDENARFIEGYYMVGLLAKAFLKNHPGEKIIHDPRLIWNTIDVVKSAGGVAVQSKTGHAFIKERMRLENAIYGGEMSAHHYFRDFGYNDSGMVPWLLVAGLMSLGQSLSSMVDRFEEAYPCSGEINYKIPDAKQIIERIYNHFLKENPEVDETDGLSLSFPSWRFSLRSSNTEPILRLNVESKGDAKLVADKVKELESIILGH